MVAEAPVQQVVLLGDQIDVERLAALHLPREGAGSTSPAGLAVMRDSETGINNVGVYRPHGATKKNLLGVQLSGEPPTQHHLAEIREAPPALPGRHRDRPPSGVLHRSLCFSTLDSDENQDRGRHACNGRCR